MEAFWLMKFWAFYCATWSQMYMMTNIKWEGRLTFFFVELWGTFSFIFWHSNLFFFDFILLIFFILPILKMSHDQMLRITNKLFLLTTRIAPSGINSMIGCIKVSYFFFFSSSFFCALRKDEKIGSRIFLSFLFWSFALFNFIKALKSCHPILWRFLLFFLHWRCNIRCYLNLNSIFVFSKKLLFYDF
jgi:hypothetical protein